MTQWEKRAHNEGRDEGRDEGMQTGQALTLLDQLEIRFGPVRDDVRHRVERADSEMLRRWARKILTADRVESVLE